MSRNENGESKSKYDVYLEERKLLIDAEREGARTFDKAILTLSAGALALSITFLEKVVPISKATTRWPLTASWIAFGVSIFLILFSFLTSQWACIKQREILDSEWLDVPKQQKQNQKNRWTTATTVLNITSIFAFAAGITFFCYFTTANLPKESTMSEKSKDYGFTPPSAPVKNIEKGFTPPKAPSKPIEEGYTPPRTPLAPPKPAPEPPVPPEKK